MTLTFISACKKDNESRYFRKSGIWKINTLRVEYLNSTGLQDSVRDFTNCGFFLFTNIKLDATSDLLGHKVYSGSGAQTRYGIEQHKGYWWYLDSKKIVTGEFSGSVPVKGKTYQVLLSKNDDETWQYTDTSRIETYHVHKLNYHESY
jgi:hypothetical protein